MTKPSPFRCVKTSPEIIRLVVTTHTRFLLSRCNIECLLHERGIAFSHETMRLWWSRFGPTLARSLPHAGL